MSQDGPSRQRLLLVLLTKRTSRCSGPSLVIMTHTHT